MKNVPGFCMRHVSEILAGSRVPHPCRKEGTTGMKGENDSNDSRH